MKQYTHDYTLVQEAESSLYSATRLMANECYDAALERINETRYTLQQYLVQDNMVEDPDTEDGWVRVSEAQTFTDEQMDFIRDLFGEQLSKNPKSTLATEELEIINRCQIIFGDPEFENVEQFIGNHSGLWTEIKSDAPRSSRPKVVRHGQIDRQYNHQLEGAGDPDCPLYGKDVRITGTFDQIQMTRDEVAAACQRLGAKSAREGICKSMDIVIIGNNPGPTKQPKIEQWRSEGYKITTLSQFDFKEIQNKYDK